MLNKTEFEKLAAQGYNHIPIEKEVLADLDTPLSTYMKLCKKPYSYLFESVSDGREENWSRYSLIGLPAKKIIMVIGNDIIISSANTILDRYSVDDPLAEIERIKETYKVPKTSNMPLFNGGLVGYFSYETIQHIEPKLKNNNKEDPINTPDILLMVSDEIVVFDNLVGKLYIIVYANPNHDNAYNKAKERLDSLTNQLNTAKIDDRKTLLRTVENKDFTSGFTQKKYEDAVRKIKQYIVDGDAMQVVLSQRLSIPFESEPIDLYRALRHTNPSPYMYFLNLKDFHIVGSSPEILVKLVRDDVIVRPIAGTRPRGQTPKEDIELEKELLKDEKELAEHLMLVDLGRNDVGKITKIGSVKLEESMSVEYYSHVMHIVSKVVGKLKESISSMEVLRATFPAGTVSGAPKIRAMEIIDELEPVKRGVYSGAIGYMSWNGNMDTAIAIRTAVIKDKILHIQVGAGIVADSVPSNEWNETINKGRSIFKAVSLVEKGL